MSLKGPTISEHCNTVRPTSKSRDWKIFLTLLWDVTPCSHIVITFQNAVVVYFYVHKNLTYRDICSCSVQYIMCSLPSQQQISFRDNRGRIAMQDRKCLLQCVTAAIVRWSTLPSIFRNLCFSANDSNTAWMSYQWRSSWTLVNGAHVRLSYPALTPD